MSQQMAAVVIFFSYSFIVGIEPNGTLNLEEMALCWLAFAGPSAHVFIPLMSMTPADEVQIDDN